MSAAPVRGIRGWPARERPRERLFQRGVRALADAELLAILLRTGAAGRDAVALARRLLSAYGSLAGLARRLPRELTRLPGMGEAKAASVVSAFELGRRLFSEPEKKSRPFTASADAARHFQGELAHLKREVFRIALLDSAHRLIKSVTVTTGTLNLALVHPREVFREAIVEQAAAVVLAHNHPGGDPSPSREDIALTRQLVSAGRAVGIPILDHLIIGANRYYSFADSRRLSA